MNAKKVCDDIIKQLIKDGFVYQITRKDLEKAIMKVRNIIDERSIDRWIRALITFEYIKYKHHNIFELNPIVCPEIFKILKDKPQTKLS